MNDAPHGYKLLRVGEAICAGDMYAEAFGMEPIEEYMIGERVLGRRYGHPGDYIYRARKRSAKQAKK